MSPPDARRLATTLLGLPPRHALVLLQLCELGRTLPAFAWAWGVSEPAAAALALEALDDLAAGLGAPRRPVEPSSVVAARAQSLAGALADGERTPEADLLAELAGQAPEVRRLLGEARAAEELAPARTVELWLRRLAIVAILALAAWLQLRRDDAPVRRVPGVDLSPARGGP